MVSMHPTKHGDTNLKADASEKSDKNGAREEIGEKAEL
jgi:hypothetical protein